MTRKNSSLNMILSGVAALMVLILIKLISDATYKPGHDVAMPAAEKLLPISCRIVMPDALADKVTAIPNMGVNSDLRLSRPLGVIVSQVLEDSARTVFKDVSVVSSVGDVSSNANVVIEVVDFGFPEVVDSKWRIKNHIGPVDDLETSITVNLKLNITRDSIGPEPFTSTVNTKCSHSSVAFPLVRLSRFMTEQTEESVRVISELVMNKAIPEGEERPARDIASIVTDLANNSEAIARGRKLYDKYCEDCHGDEAKGDVGVPDLTDDEWLNGGAVDGKAPPEATRNIIVNGDAHICPEYGQIVTSEEIDALANYVLSLSGQENNSEMAALGEQRFNLCSPCHGVKGEGLPILGAPNLTDDRWLYSNELDAIKTGIRMGLKGEMPGFRCKLSDHQVDLLTAYVYSLSK
jgi:cbb3-type cytochrome c oxidase subunit III